MVGATGRHVVAGLLARGVDVRAMVRHRLTAGLPEQVRMVEQRPPPVEEERPP